MAHAQKRDFVFLRNGRVHLNRRGRHFSRLLAADVCASAVVMLDTAYSEVAWRVLATHSIRQFPLHFPSRASPCAITFQLPGHWYFWFLPCPRCRKTRTSTSICLSKESCHLNVLCKCIEFCYCLALAVGAILNHFYPLTVVIYFLEIHLTI